MRLAAPPKGWQNPSIDQSLMKSPARKPAPALRLPTVSYCTKNKGTPFRKHQVSGGRRAGEDAALTRGTLPQAVVPRSMVAQCLPDFFAR